MFQVFSIAGRLFSGNLEQWRQVAATSAVTRAQRLRPVGRDVFSAPAVAAGAAQPAATAAPASGVLAAYAATQAGPARRPLTQVADVMHQQVQTVPLAATVLQAWQALARTGFGQAPVVDAQGHLVGLFLRADLMRVDLLEHAAADASAWQTLLAEPVHTLMWTPVPATLAETDLRRVATVLLDTGLPGLPVVDAHSAVIGFVSRSDILRAVTADPPLDLWG